MESSKGLDLKYVKIYNHYKNLIAGGLLKAGERLPTEKEIGQTFSVSRITVTKALNLLANESYIYRIQGGGTFVKEKDAYQNHNAVEFISFITSFKPVATEMDLIEAIEKKVKEAGYLLSISNTNDDAEVERQLVTSIKDKAKGIILYPSRSNRNIDLFYDLFKEEYPIVYVDKYPFNVPCSYVVSDNFDGGYQIGRRLVQMGHRRIALIFHEITEFTSEMDRYNGFIKAVGEGGISRESIKTVSLRGKEVKRDIQRIFQQFLDIGRDRITAIYACNDVITYSLMEYIRHNNIELPEGFVIASFDDIFVKPPNVKYISVRQNMYAIGEESARIVLEMIDNKSFYGSRLSIPIEVAENL